MVLSIKTTTTSPPHGSQKSPTREPPPPRDDARDELRVLPSVRGLAHTLEQRSGPADPERPQPAGPTPARVGHHRVPPPTRPAGTGNRPAAGRFTLRAGSAAPPPGAVKMASPTTLPDPPGRVGPPSPGRLVYPAQPAPEPRSLASPAHSDRATPPGGEVPQEKHKRVLTTLEVRQQPPQPPAPQVRLVSTPHADLVLFWQGSPDLVRILWCSNPGFLVSPSFWRSGWNLVLPQNSTS